MHNLRTRLATLTRRNEQGVSLVEILVYVTILAVLLAGVIALVVSSTNASSRFTTTTASQAEVNNTQASIMRDLSITQQIFKAGGDHIQFSVLQDNKQYRMTIFSYGGQTKQDEIPSYIKTILTENPTLNSALPVEAAVMSIREEYGNPDAKTITALTKGYDPDAYADRDLWLFSYYDDKNDLIPLASNKQFSNAAQDINSISRIAFRIAADAPGRASKVQAETSVTPPLNKTNVSSNLNNSTSVAPELPAAECPLMDVHIPRGARAATIEWTQVTGATQYYITRAEYRNSVWTDQRTYTIDNPSLTSFTEAANELTIGGTYRYTLTLDTVKGTEDCGQSVSVSVIPAETTLRNLNPHAYARTMSGLTANNLAGVNSTGTATVLNSDLTVRSTNRSAATVEPLAGARYTVARGLNNQIAFAGTYGALEYIIYRDGAEIARVPAATTGSSTTEINQRYHYVDSNQNYGDLHNYQVVARNNGGNNPTVTGDGHAYYPGNTTLISPPDDTSTYSVVANDNEVVSNGNVLSSNTISVRPTDHVVGFRTKYASSETAADCAVGIPQVDVSNTTAAGYRMDENISLSTATGFLSTVNTAELTQTGVGWGTTTCYRMIPYNDAGSYPYAEGGSNTTARVKADQHPERFRITSVRSGTNFYNADYSEHARLNNSTYVDYGGRADCLLYAGPNKNQFGTDLIYCDGNPNKTYSGGPWGNGNWSPIGAIVPQKGQHQLFRNQNLHQIYGTQQEVIGRWAVSSGARAGYSLTRKVESSPSGRGTITGYKTNRTEKIPFLTGKQTNNGIRFSGEFPGVVMSISMKSEAMNGKTRTGLTSGGSTAYKFATNPAPSLAIKAGYYRHYHSVGTTTATQWMNRPSHGFGGTAYVTSKVDGRTILNNASANVTNSAYRFYSSGFVAGDLYHIRHLTWNTGTYGTLKSAPFQGTGKVTGTPISAPAGFWPEIYPSYWGNMSGRYSGTSNLNASSDYYSYWPNTRTILKSGEVAEPFDPVVGSEDIPPTMIMDCAIIYESSPDYTEQNCEYGDGIAAPPMNLTAERSGASTYLIKWDAVTAANSYRVIVKKGNTQVLNTTTTNLQATLTGVSTQGVSYTVIVKAINNAGEGEESTISFVSSSVPNQVSNLTVTMQADGTTWRAAWTAPSGATNYTAQLYKGSTLIQTGNVTGTSYDFTNITDYETTYRVVVVAKNLAGSGAAREITFTTPAPTNPPAAPNITITKLSQTSFKVSWPAVATANSYRVKVVGTHSGAAYDNTATSTSVTVNGLTQGDSFRVDVNALNTAGSSPLATSWFYSLPDPVTNLNVTVPEYGGTYKATWTAAAGASSYHIKIYRGSTLLAAPSTTLTSYTLPSKHVKEDGQTYKIEVVSYSIATQVSSVVSKTFVTNLGPSFPTTLEAPTASGGVATKVNATGVSFTLTAPVFSCPTGWTTNYEFEVFTMYTNSFRIEESVYVGTSNVATVPASLIDGTGDYYWYYRYRCLKSPGIVEVSDWSSGLVTQHQELPAKPATPTVGSLVGHKATVSWAAAANAESYQLRVTMENGATRAWTTTARSLTVAYPSDTTGRALKFQVRAKNAAGYGSWSAVRKSRVLDSDYTNDGKADWMTHHAASTQEGRIYKGNGTGGQSGHIKHGSGWNGGFQIRAGMDFTNDGNLDIISYDTKSSGRKLWLYKGNGSGGFASRVSLSGQLASGTRILAMGDFNADGNADFLIATGSTARLYKGNGAGGFSTSNAFSLPTTAVNTRAVEAGDFNGDGHLDILLKYNDTHRIYFNNGSGVFNTYYQAGTGWQSIRILTPYDINGDNRDDIIVISGNSMRSYVQNSNGTGAFLAGVQIVSPGMGSGWSNWTQWSALRDMNNDGRPDLHTVRSDGALYFARANTANNTNNPFSGNLVAVGSGWQNMNFWSNVN